MTEEEAANTLCPLARTFADGVAVPFCRGSRCMVWRWNPITTADPRWVAAIKAAIEKNGDKAPFVKSSREAADLMKNERPTSGYCGIGGAG